MKRAATRLDDIASWQNLTRAVERASRGKRHAPEVRAFLDALDSQLATLRADILAEQVTVGSSCAFSIRDPKPRVIHAPCFRERVLHHAIMAHVAPVLERALVDDTFACRKGKGTLAAVARCQQHVQRFPWYAKLDIRKYFASIDHAILKAQLRRRFASRPLLRLLDRIIAAHQEVPGRGLPIGSLTSQWFANTYLNPLDRFLLESQHVRGLVRYMDDFLFWDRSRERIREVVQEVRAFLQGELHLAVNDPVPIQRSARGVTLCGYRVYPGTIRLARSRRQRFARAKHRWESRYLRGEIDGQQLQRGLDVALAIVAHADSTCWLRQQSRRSSSPE
jgi:RNA-directed DNA polymerase